MPIKRFVVLMANIDKLEANGDTFCNQLLKLIFIAFTTRSDTQIQDLVIFVWIDTHTDLLHARSIISLLYSWSRLDRSIELATYTRSSRMMSLIGSQINQLKPSTSTRLCKVSPNVARVYADTADPSMVIPLLSLAAATGQSVYITPPFSGT